MSQQVYSFDGFTPTRQPSKVEFSFATTSTSDSGNNQFGVMNNKPMFTKEAYDISFPRLYAEDAKGMMQAIVGKAEINFHYWSPYYGEWRTSRFYVANVTKPEVIVKEGREGISGLSFQITGKYPI